MITKSLNCFVVFRFKEEYFQIYNDILKRLIEKLEDHYKLKINIEKGNDVLLPYNREIASQLEKSIREADLIIANISEFSENLLWEIGYATALKKSIIYICHIDKLDKVPFILQSNQIIHYSNTESELKELSIKLYESIIKNRVIEDIIEHKLSIYSDDNVSTYFKSFVESLKQIKNDSILSILAKKEIERYTKRIAKLKDGYFELRNEKPKSELIEYYSRYVSQLNQKGCVYKTISHIDFWKEITEDGKTFDYLHDNAESARKGTQIKRIFIVDLLSFENRNVSRDPSFKKILESHFKTSKGVKNLQTRLFFTETYEEDLRSYKNVAIWKKNSEILAFFPDYNQYGKMTKTDFYYDNLHSNKFSASKEKILKAEERFNRLWEKGEDLDSKHFEIKRDD